MYVCTDELLSLLGSVGAVGEEEMEEGGGREGVREEVHVAGRLSRAMLDELNSDPLLLPVGLSASSCMSLQP